MVEMKILFVCLGNICRSPMAEAVMQHLITQNNLPIEVDSAGTSSWHIGEKADPRSIKCCKNHGIQIKHLGRQITLKDFSDFDYLLCMDKRNLMHLQSISPKDAKGKVFLLGSFDESAKGEEIEDPYEGEMEDFEYNFQQCMRSCLGFLKQKGYKINNTPAHL